MSNSRIKKNFSSIYLYLILLTIGIRFPIKNFFSSLSVFIILLAFFHHFVFYFSTNKKFNKKLIRYNITFSSIIMLYTIIAFLNKKLAYPTYPLIILFFQWTFFLIISNLNYDSIKRTFTSFIILNFGFYLIQIIGALIGSESLLKLEFILAEKSRDIEFVSNSSKSIGPNNRTLTFVICNICQIIIISLYNFKDYFLNSGFKKFVLFFYFFTFSIISYFQLNFCLCNLFCKKN
jgi:hypothetical protein